MPLNTKSKPLILASFHWNLGIFVFVVWFRTFLQYLILFSWPLTWYPNLGFPFFVFRHFWYRQNQDKPWTWLSSGKGDDHSGVLHLHLYGMYLMIGWCHEFCCGTKSAGKIIVFVEEDEDVSLLNWLVQIVGAYFFYSRPSALFCI